MTNREKGWGIVILILVVLGYLVPYTLLRNVTYWYGSLLVWIGLAVIVVIVNVILTKDWGRRG